MLAAVEALLVSLHQPSNDPPAELNQDTTSSPQTEGKGDPGVSLDLLVTNSSSSSSVAEDWVVNQIPDFSLYDGDASQTETPSGPDPNEQLENWSRGTALTDPVSGEPLQPVTVHQPPLGRGSEPGEVKNESRKMVNAITEKRAALTAYDLISSRATRAAPSAAVLFEKEARAEVLREKPAAGLQDISAAVHQRWKNLGEDDRKK